MKIIRLKASTFHSSKLTKKLLEKQRFFLTFYYYEAQIKSGGFSSRKQNEGNLIITKLTPFLKDNLAEHQYLTIC